MNHLFFKSVSVPWTFASGLARSMSRSGILHSEKLDARVISVGNIQAGGAGKTPIVAKIANEGIEQGLRVCILSRGYKSSWETSGGVLVPGYEPASPTMCGDEPALLHDLCPKAYIGVGANRVEQYRKALELLRQASRGARFDWVILDDGFQNWKIKKDLEVVALTSAKSGEVVFRDRLDALEYADLIIWTKGEVRPDVMGKPLVKVRYQLPKASNDIPLWLFTGIADGESAVKLAKEFGYPIVKHQSFGDHFHYDKKSIENYLTLATREGCRVALTGKDWVKWRDFGVSKNDVVILEPELVIEEGKDLWSRALWGK